MNLSISLVGDCRFFVKAVQKKPCPYSQTEAPSGFLGSMGRMAWRRRGRTAFVNPSPFIDKKNEKRRCKAPPRVKPA